MILKIGNRTNGFTLLELMTATAIFSLGAVMIYEAYFICLDSFNYYNNYLKVLSWADEKIWQAQDDIKHFNTVFHTVTGGEFALQNKNFNWDLSYNPIDDAQGLYQINLVLSWQEGQRKARLSRSAYAFYQEKK